MFRDQMLQLGPPNMPNFRPMQTRRPMRKRSHAYYRLASVFGQGMRRAWIVSEPPCQNCLEDCGPYEQCVSLDLYGRATRSKFAGGACTNCAFLGCPEECAKFSTAQARTPSSAVRHEVVPFAAGKTTEWSIDSEIRWNQARVILNPQARTSSSGARSIVKIAVNGSSASRARVSGESQPILSSAGPEYRYDVRQSPGYTQDCPENKELWAL